MKQDSFDIKYIAKPTIANPIEVPSNRGFVSDSDQIAFDPHTDN